MKHWIHYNRRATDGRVWTVHNAHGCFHLSKIVVKVEIESQYKPNKKTNPRAFFTCVGTLFTNGDIGVIR